MADMGKLVRNHARELFLGDRLHEAGGNGDGRVLRVPSRGECVRLRIVHDIDLGHRQIRIPRELADHVIKFARVAALVRIHQMRAIHPQDRFVRIPIGE